MEIQPFADRYELAAPLYGTSVAELRRRDADRTPPIHRWLALRDDIAIGAVTAWLRPDDRQFLSFAGEEPPTYGPLAQVAAEAAAGGVYVTVDADDAAAVDAVRSAGFETEIEFERFRIQFDMALRRLARAWVPSGFSLHRADAVDEDRLFELDNTIRQRVPGTDGWVGDRRWFHEELIESPPFDPTAYLVGVEDRSREYVGLVRIWRNPDGPRLGLVGVVPEYRHSPIAAALLKQALAAASRWGHDTFTTETSLVNSVIYPRMRRLEAESMGRFLQLVRGERREVRW